MTDIVSIADIEARILTLRGQRVLLDSDIAELYGVETRDVNKSVKNNPDKFPEGYILELHKSELADLRWKFSTAKLAMTRTMPKAFTEKGLYMLATILKSQAATQAHPEHHRNLQQAPRTGAHSQATIGLTRKTTTKGPHAAQW